MSEVVPLSERGRREEYYNPTEHGLEKYHEDFFAETDIKATLKAFKEEILKDTEMIILTSGKQVGMSFITSNLRKHFGTLAETEEEDD